MVGTLLELRWDNSKTLRLLRNLESTVDLALWVPKGFYEYRNAFRKQDTAYTVTRVCASPNATIKMLHFKT